MSESTGINLKVEENIYNKNYTVSCEIINIESYNIAKPKGNWVSEYHINLLIPTLLVLIGWRIIYLNAKKLATRSESKAILDSIIKLYEELDNLAVDFWLGEDEKQDSNRYLMIVMAKFETLSNRSTDLYKRNVNIDKSVLNNYYSALTLNCENIRKMSQSECAIYTQNILDLSRKNISALYENYNHTYKPTYKITKSFVRS